MPSVSHFLADGSIELLACCWLKTIFQLANLYNNLNMKIIELIKLIYIEDLIDGENMYYNGRIFISAN